MIGTYLPMFLMIAIAIILAVLFFTGASFLGGKLDKTPEKMKPFECGSESSGGNHLKLSVKFYLTAILFVVFDIEAVFDNSAKNPNNPSVPPKRVTFGEETTNEMLFGFLGSVPAGKDRVRLNREPPAPPKK